MHYRFEIPLLVNEILGKTPGVHRPESEWRLMRQHLERFLLRYHQEHGVLPNGRHNVGMTRPLYLEIGVVDFDVARRRMQTDLDRRVNPAVAGRAGTPAPGMAPGEFEASRDTHMLVVRGGRRGSMASLWRRITGRNNHCGRHRLRI